jgi:hypothetical protein
MPAQHVEEDDSRGQKIVGLDVLMPRYYEMQQQRALTRGGAKRGNRHSRAGDAVTTVDGHIDKAYWTRTRKNSFISPVSDSDQEVSFT